jgi:hypothetical protein
MPLREDGTERRRRGSGAGARERGPAAQASRTAAAVAMASTDSARSEAVKVINPYPDICKWYGVWGILRETPSVFLDISLKDFSKKYLFFLLIRFVCLYTSSFS